MLKSKCVPIPTYTLCEIRYAVDILLVVAMSSKICSKFQLSVHLFSFNAVQIKVQFVTLNMQSQTAQHALDFAYHK